jgi:large subunit ribosomal protein L14e
VYTRFIEVGRVVLIQKGEYSGRLAVIVEIVDHNRAVVDGPSSGVPRQVLLYSQAMLTKFVVKNMPRSAGSKTVQKRFDEQNIAALWAESHTAKKLANKATRRELSDFDRFKVMVLQKKRSRIIKS